MSETRVGGKSWTAFDDPAGRFTPAYVPPVPQPVEAVPDANARPWDVCHQAGSDDDGGSDAMDLTWGRVSVPDQLRNRQPARRLSETSCPTLSGQPGPGSEPRRNNDDDPSGS
jgi:hypothetical protein